MQVGVHDDDEHLCECDGCTQIDFLSAKCTDCGKRFCSNHIAGSVHQCTGKINVIVPTCPICNAVVPLEYPRQSADEAVCHHLDRGCVAAARNTTTTTTTANTSSLSHANERLTGSNAVLASLPPLTAFEYSANNKENNIKETQERQSQRCSTFTSSSSKSPSQASLSYVSTKNKSNNHNKTSAENSSSSSGGATPASVLHSINQALGKVIGNVTMNEREQCNNSTGEHSSLSQTSAKGNGFCHVSGCPNQVGVRVLCEDCRQLFCIDHRNPSSHNCPATYAKRNIVNNNNKVFKNNGTGKKFVMNSNKNGSSSNDKTHKTFSLFAHSAATKKANDSPGASNMSHSANNNTSNLNLSCTSLTNILSNLYNSRASAKGKSTESPSDMVTPLVVFAISPHAEHLEQEEQSAALSKAKTSSKTSQVSASTKQNSYVQKENKGKINSVKSNNADELYSIPAFYMHCNVNFSLGRVLDLALSEASLLSALVEKKIQSTNLSLYVITLPVPKEASDVMYPSQSLPTLVKKSALIASRQSLLFITNTPSLPNGTVKVVRAMQRKLERVAKAV